MKYLLLIIGMAIALLGFNFWWKYFNICRKSVKVAGRVVDSRKVNATEKMPSGWAAVADYEVNGKHYRGVSVLPMAQKYANGYRIELFADKTNPQSFVPVAFTRAMQIYGLLCPIGLALSAWGISMFF